MHEPLLKGRANFPAGVRDAGEGVFRKRYHVRGPEGRCCRAPMETVRRMSGARTSPVTASRKWGPSVRQPQGSECSQRPDELGGRFLSRAFGEGLSSARTLTVALRPQSHSPGLLTWISYGMIPLCCFKLLCLWLLLRQLQKTNTGSHPRIREWGKALP